VPRVKEQPDLVTGERRRFAFFSRQKDRRRM